MKKETIVNTLVLNGPLFYFSACALLGIHFDPEEGAGMTYKIYMVSILLMGVFLWAKGFIKGNNRRKVLPLCVLFIYTIAGILQGYMQERIFLKMVCFSIPAACAALNMKGRGELAEVMKIMDLLLPIFTIAFVFMIKNILISISLNQGTYDQNASYMVAYCFLIDIFLLSNRNSYLKFNFLDNKWYTTFKIILLPCYIVMAFFGGGRGAFITILVGVIFVIWRNKKRISPKMIQRGCLGLLLILLLLIFVLSKLNDDYYTLLSDNFGRITALIDGGKIDTSASSGRDNIWKEAWNLVINSPIMGYGLFSYLSRIFFPHNIFLEVLLQGGFALFLFFSMFLIHSFNKYHKMLKFDDSQIWLLPLMIHIFTQLLFSGSYMFEPFFWFSLSYIYNYKFVKPIKVGVKSIK